MTQQDVRLERRINGKTVFRMRKLQKLTQARVATRACEVAGDDVLDHTTVAHVEKGRQPTVDTMGHIANGLGVHIDEITYFTAVYAPADAERVA